MKKTIHRTSEWGFGSMIHVIHMSDDVPKLNAFYEDVFGGALYMGVDEPSYLPPEKRWASLLLVSDLCVETMAPELPLDVATPVGKFYDKFGSRWHSIGYQVEDLGGLGRHLMNEGVFLGKPGGGRVDDPDEHIYFYPNPRQTGGVMVECCSVEMSNDARLRDDWSSLRKLWAAHPLGVERTGWVTLGVKDIEEHVALWERLFQVIPVHEETSEALGRRSMWVQFGDILLELATPISGGTALADHVETWGDMIFSVTLKVADLDRAEGHLKSKGIRTTRPEPDTLDADTQDTIGARWSFTTRDIPNDPFAND
jgi:catechol 2,3-dioxygenase-like lactoylglutathione lyase family enzyme